ncbi:response regulator [Porphyrobacter sp. LM 6]|jgi:DNA-binding response OmpR family regulator|uniref:response regulator n=1 Tax=Porphyrobacter sp. LM 6 TaxID=1896196 RepID=UPI000847C480|nr:response regulator [Porphyrobacter sp. LM 6]AOL95404.1 response regulator NasT [Porphyrobacter sp. LM 6]
MALRILVAEHDHVTACDLCDTVAEAGYEVEGPHDGITTTIEACQSLRPDLVILDIALSDGMGHELAQRLLDDNVPVILHSERDAVPDVAARFPRATTLAKPCPPADLLGAVSRVLMPA